MSCVAKWTSPRIMRRLFSLSVNTQVLVGRAERTWPLEPGPVPESENTPKMSFKQNKKTILVALFEERLLLSAFSFSELQP